MEEELSLVEEENSSIPFPTIGNINKELYEKEESTEQDGLAVDYVGVISELKSQVEMQGWFTDLWKADQDDVSLKVYKKSWFKEELRAWFSVTLKENMFSIGVGFVDGVNLSTHPEGYGRNNATGFLEKDLPFDPHILGEVVDEFDVLLTLVKEIDVCFAEKVVEE
jgi:hypothetical protein